MRQERMLCTAILAGLLLTAAFISGGNVLAAEQNPCTGDIAKFCSQAGPGWLAVVRCLDEHESELSDACREYEAKFEKPRAESREPKMRLIKLQQSCADDVARFCKETGPRTGGIEGCLKEHLAALSDECRQAVTAPGAPAEEGKTR